MLIQILRFVALRITVFSLFASLFALFYSAPLWALSSSDYIMFKTRDQNLFQGKDLNKQKFQLHLLDEHIPRTTKGNIRTLPDELPVSTLQTIWNTALQRCQNTIYTLKVEGVTLFSRAPSQQECIDGDIRQKYCVAPPMLGWTGCVDIGGNRKTWIKSVGSGIGPKPTSPATRSYDIGMELAYEMDLEMGVEGHMVINPGSVDVDFAGDASLTSDREFALAGEIFEVNTRFESNEPAYRLRSRFPNIDFSLGTFIHARAKVETQYASVNYATGDQMRGGETIYAADSRNSTLGNTTADGVVRFFDTEWLGLGFSPAGIDLRVKEETLPLFTGGLYRTDFVLPGIRPTPGVPGFSFADLAVLTPTMDSPVENGFNCGDCYPLRELIDMDDIITNSVPTGTRELLAGVHDGNGWALPLTNDGIHDSDFFRLDFDLDVISLVWGVPLGAQWEGPKLPNKAGLLGPVAAVELNALDADVASFWSLDQTLSFTPNLEVTLRFEPAAQVRTASDIDFVVRTEVTVPVGESVAIRQTETGVKITPVYSLANNEFLNDTKINLTLALQESLLQMRAYGLIPSLLGAGLGFNPNFVALQITPQLANPIPVFQNTLESRALEDFEDVTGTTLFVATTEGESKVIDRNSNEQNGETPSAGGGGGSFSLFTLIALLLARVLFRCKLIRRQLI